MDLFLLRPLFEKKTVKMSEKTYGLYKEFTKKSKVNESKEQIFEDKYGLDSFEGIKYSDSFSETGYEEIDAEDWTGDDYEEFVLDVDEDTMSDERYNEIKEELEELIHQNIEGEKINENDKKDLIKQYAKSLIDLTDDCHGNESLWSAMVDKITDELLEEI